MIACTEQALRDSLLHILEWQYHQYGNEIEITMMIIKQGTKLVLCTSDYGHIPATTSTSLLLL